MEAFWNERAREDAFFFVDSRLEYGHPDVARFFADGEADLAEVLRLTGGRIGPGDTVVDVGCGLGRLTRALAGRARAVVALDVSGEMLERARELNPELENVRWVKGDGTSLAGIDDASADAVISHVVFQHIPDPRVTLGYVREMGRVLRPGGWAGFQVSDDPTVHRRRRRGPARLLRRALGREPGGQDDPAWLGSAVDLGAVERSAGEAGMDLERVEHRGTQYCMVLLRRRAT
jgi:SAM-dependent methyltransferase